MINKRDRDPLGLTPEQRAQSDFHERFWGRQPEVCGYCRAYLPYHAPECVTQYSVIEGEWWE